MARNKHTIITISLFTLLIGLGVPSLGGAEVYKIINPDGSVSYTDQPTENAEQISTEPSPPITTSKPAKTTRKTPAADSTTTSEKQAEPVTYTSFSIVAPKNGESIRANNGTITVTIKIIPGLAANQGDKITLFLDGKPVGKPGSQTSFKLQNLDRGSHTVSATLKNAKGQILHAAPSVSFHIIRAHINSKNHHNKFPNFPVSKQANNAQ